MVTLVVIYVLWRCSGNRNIADRGRDYPLARLLNYDVFISLAEPFKFGELENLVFLSTLVQATETRYFSAERTSYQHFVGLFIFHRKKPPLTFRMLGEKKKKKTKPTYPYTYRFSYI